MFLSNIRLPRFIGGNFVFAFDSQKVITTYKSFAIFYQWVLEEKKMIDIQYFPSVCGYYIRIHRWIEMNN